MSRSEYGKRVLTSCGIMKGTGSCGVITGSEIAVAMSRSPVPDGVCTGDNSTERENDGNNLYGRKNRYRLD